MPTSWRSVGCGGRLRPGFVSGDRPCALARAGDDDFGHHALVWNQHSSDQRPTCVKLRLSHLLFVVVLAVAVAMSVSVSACSSGQTQSDATLGRGDTATTVANAISTAVVVSVPDRTVSLPSAANQTTTSIVPVAACAGVDPFQVASTFLTAAQNANASVYRTCVLAPTAIAGILDAVITTANVSSFATEVATGGYLLSDEFIRDLYTFPKICCTYSFGSPDLPFDSNDATMHYIDPNGRADITVRTASDGKYHVVNAFIEFHA